MKKLRNLLLIMLAFPIGVLAQIGFSVENENGYMSNAFSNYLARPDYYTSLTSRLNHDWINENEGLRVYYDINLNGFKQYQDRNFFNHNIGLNYYHYLGENGHKINAGMSVGQRYHTQAYQWYEFQQAYVFANAKFILSEQLYAYAGFNIRWRNYNLLDAFSHWQSILFYRISRFLDSGTTIIAEADLLTKRYYPAGQQSDVAELPEIVTLGEGTSQQLSIMLKLAQAITPKMGISLKMLARTNLLRTVRYIGSTSGYYYSDEELFDDVYGYHGQEFNLSLKRKLPWKMMMTVGSGLALKHYDQRLALDLDGVPFDDNRLRDDTRWTYWLSLQKRFKLAKNLSPITFSLNWYGVQNNSNDPYYHYKGQYITFGLSQEF